MTREMPRRKQEPKVRFQDEPRTVTAEVVATTTTAPHSRVVGQVMETKQYGLFRFVNGNRVIRQNKALENSIKEYGILQPIKVDSEYNILEGQHRYTFAKKHSLPIKYIVTNEAELTQVKEIAELNNTSRKWNVSDYIHSHAAQGKEDYIKLKQLIDDTRDINAPIFTLGILAVGGRGLHQRAHVSKIAQGDFAFYNYDGLLVFLEDYRKFLRRTGIQTSRDMVFAVFYLYTLKDFNLERLINKVNSTNKNERLIGVRKAIVIVELLVEAYNHHLSTDSENFIGYTISVEPRTRGQITLTGDVSDTLVNEDI